MKKLTLYFFLFAIVLLFTNCNARQNKQLIAHQMLLTDYANGTMSTEEKIDATATSFVKLMNEALSIVNPKKGVAYVKRYGQQNQASIDKILDEVSEWQAEMTTLEKIGFVASMVQKPYAKDLVNLVPKFQRKFNQVQFMMNLGDRLKKIVTFGK